MKTTCDGCGVGGLELIEGLCLRCAVKQVHGLMRALDRERSEAQVWKDERDRYRGLLMDLDRLFECDHVKNGPDDCANLVRHVKEALRERDAFRKQCVKARLI